jgi:LmbE family N-acetylglucosaminyl deacetylase
MQLSALDQVNAQYRHIYLQPHFDDAALSCGGTIALQRATGQRILVVTVFGGMPQRGAELSSFAARTHQRMGIGPNAAEAVQQRRAEEAAAAEALRVDTLILDFPDAIYRGSPALYTSEDALFGNVNAADLALDEQLAGVLMQLHERAPLAVIYSPLGVGHHVDHQLVCSAADRLAQRKLAVKFYEDFPYVAQPGALETRQKELSIAMEPEFVEVSGLIRTKEEAVAQYSSQIPQLFGTQDAMRQALRGYSSSLRRSYPGIELERYWRW